MLGDGRAERENLFGFPMTCRGDPLQYRLYSWQSDVGLLDRFLNP